MGSGLQHRGMGSWCVGLGYSIEVCVWVAALRHEVGVTAVRYGAWVTALRCVSCVTALKYVFMESGLQH